MRREMKWKSVYFLQFWQGIKFNRSLSSSIIRLVNYNIITSLIYKSDLKDAWGFQYMAQTEISVVKYWKELDRRTLLWKTKFSKNIPIIED